MTDRSVHRVPAAAAAEPGGPLDPATVSRLRLVIARLYRQLAQASSHRDLSFAQLSALARIEEHGPLRLGRLAAHEQVAAPSMTRTIAPLAERGLIHKEADPRDGRSCLVTVTPAGRQALSQLRRERSEMLARRITQLGAEEREILQAAVPVLELLLMEPEAAGDTPDHASHPEADQTGGAGRP